ncbi:MAG TPA: ABC transporter ATP-binding protein [Thermoanaerobaculia bacterium]|nr:ABC transporter ATP-binding protein [Thermoanaerobaculia bacterium]
MSQPLIEVSGLRKLFSTSLGKARVTALDGIDFSVQPGELFGLLGPNGAGKTTTVKILLGLTHATEGRATLAGLPVSDPESRRRAGYLPEGHKIPGYLTARQALTIFGRMSGMTSSAIVAKIPVLMEKVRLTKWTDVRVKKFSKGMTQRLGLASALIHDPNILLLDEPTDGVDPVGRREIRDILREEARNGTAVLLNSHLLSEIELTCDRVAVLRNGKVAAQGTIDELTLKSARYKMFADPIDDALIAAFRESGAGVERVNGHIELSVTDLAHLNALVDKLRAGGGLISELSPMRSTLEDVFVDLVRTGDAQIGARSETIQETPAEATASSQQVN